MARADLHIVEHHPHNDGPRVVIVHGCPDRSKNFARVIHMLGDLHVAAYDRRGYGKSMGAQPAVNGFRDHVGDLIEVLDGRPSVVCGQSAGGAIAMMAATIAPQLFLGLGAWEPPMPWVEWWDKTGNEHWMVRWLELDPPMLGENFNRELIGDDTWQALPERTREMLRTEGTAFRYDLISQTTKLFNPEDVSCPTVIGAGSVTDNHSQENFRQLAKRTGGEVFVAEGASHVAHTQHPEVWAELVRRTVAAASRQD